MSQGPTPPPAVPGPLPPPTPASGSPGKQRRRFGLPGVFSLRGDLAPWQVALWGALCLALVLGLWYLTTRSTGGPDDDPELGRLFPSTVLPSPAETAQSFHGLWFERELTRNLLATLKRVVLGFGLAALAGVPLGILCGCFPRLNAFLLPLTIFGRNIPIAALIPLTFALFGIEEKQKIMFLFLATVAFVISDTARAVAEVGQQYVDTALTLGASSWQVVLKVLVPLAMPAVFNSLRLLFGLAFGYIMLAEVITTAAAAGGIGMIINQSQRRLSTETAGHIILILLVIPVVALVIDRLLFWVQKELFPHRYGGAGILNQAVAALLHAWDDLKIGLFGRLRPASLPDAGPAASPDSPTPKT